MLLSVMRPQAGTFNGFDASVALTESFFGQWHAEDALVQPYGMVLVLSIKAGRASETFRILAFVPANEAHFNSGRVTCSDTTLLLE